jgi:hypothetical protein
MAFDCPPRHQGETVAGQPGSIERPVVNAFNRICSAQTPGSLEDKSIIKPKARVYMCRSLTRSYTTSPVYFSRFY